jgi:hypothetical protein
MGKQSTTLFFKQDGGVCADHCKRYVEATNSNFEYSGPAEKVEVDDNGSLVTTFYPAVDIDDTDILDNRAMGFRDGWEAAMMYLGRSTDCVSAYVAWMFNKDNPQRRTRYTDNLGKMVNAGEEGVLEKCS